MISTIYKSHLQVIGLYLNFNKNLNIYLINIHIQIKIFILESYEKIKYHVGIIILYYIKLLIIFNTPI